MEPQKLLPLLQHTRLIITRHSKDRNVNGNRFNKGMTEINTHKENSKEMVS
jgi:hypothetical protein